MYGQERFCLKQILKDIPKYECQIQGYKMRKLTDLTLEEKIDVANDAIFLKDYHQNICSRYNIGRESIKTLLKNLKKDPDYLKK